MDTKVIHPRIQVPSYIVKNHNQIYYFRFIIPKKLKHLFSNHKREIRRSLKTRSRRIALQKARKLYVIMDIDKVEQEVEKLEHR
ncbi:MAG: hypothetical protein Q9M50_07855 [Methylococcales bacterium]|nr:hypothetical protein [Methylococcales bacterium]